MLPEKFKTAIQVVTVIGREPKTARTILKETGLEISLGYIEGILTQLTQRGIVESRKGPRGGFNRAYPVITVLALYEALYGYLDKQEVPKPEVGPFIVYAVEADIRRALSEREL